MRIAMIQLAAAAGEKEENIRRAFALMEEAAQNADWLVLPELWTLGYNFHDLESRATRPGDGLLARLSGFALTHKVILAAGTLPILKGGVIRNTALIFGRDGNVLGTYIKRHLFGGYLEAKLMKPGRRLMKTDINGLCCGMGICYELYFPRMYRKMAENGTTLVLVPASWPLVHISKWEILARARAIENGMWICAVNMAGTYHDVKLGGHSVLVSPEGEVLARAGSEEEICYGEIDRDAYPGLGKQLAVIRGVKRLAGSDS